MSGLVNPMTVPAGEQRKAIVAGLLAAVLTAVPMVGSGATWWAILSAAIVAGLGTYAGAFQVSNDKPVAPETGANMQG